MSYKSWHTYGYGICVSEMEEIPAERIQELLVAAPKFADKINQWLSESGIEDPGYDDYVDYDQDFMLGMATILKEVILEAEGIEFTACDDYDGKQYLVYEPSYPWQVTQEETGLTEERIYRMLLKYVHILTDQEPDVDYQTVENGG